MEAKINKGTILLADNDLDYLTIAKEYLERAGYAVLTAQNFDDTRHALEKGGFNLAVLDVRLTRERDKKDTGGLILAKTHAPKIPKIVITDYPKWDDVRDAMIPSQDGIASNILYVAKREGHQALLDAICVALRASATPAVQALSEPESSDVCVPLNASPVLPATIGQRDFEDRARDELIELLRMVRMHVNNLHKARLLLIVAGSLLIFAGVVVVFVGLLRQPPSATTQVVGTVSTLSGVVTGVLSKVFDKPIRESEARMDRVLKWLQNEVSPAGQTASGRARG